ncbi:MAG TPA: OmpA family protein [Vicinamibacterales bacterium]|jgi:outer membrane protein OmpA-like peptidoglycan-associated protein|nr:OmpA family protein [Vicinamibacterales bacterium]
MNVVLGISSMSIVLALSAVPAGARPQTTGAPDPACSPAAETAFGSTTRSDVTMEGKIYFLPPVTYAQSLKDFDGQPSQGSVYTGTWNIAPRDFTSGFPGVSDRYEWFAIDYQGSIYVPVAGQYGFRLSSDDGSTLAIDGATVVDNDGVHAMKDASGTVSLTAGSHAWRLRYFQGPATVIGLEVYVTPPGGKERIFSLSDFDQHVLESRRLLGVTEDANAIHVRLGAEVLFDTGEYALRPDAATSLAAVATVLRGESGRPITIGGHTDSIGRAAANQTLSEQRANAVKDWLVTNGGISAGCIGTKGYGATKPVASNATAAGRQKNRRVEIVIAKGTGQ